MKYDPVDPVEREGERILRYLFREQRRNHDALLYAIDELFDCYGCECGHRAAAHECHAPCACKRFVPKVRARP